MDNFHSVNFFIDSLRKTVDEISAGYHTGKDEPEIVKIIKEKSRNFCTKLDTKKYLKTFELKKMYEVLDKIIEHKELFKEVEIVKRFLIKLLTFLSQKGWTHKKSFLKLIQFLLD